MSFRSLTKFILYRHTLPNSLRNSSQFCKCFNARCTFNDISTQKSLSSVIVSTRLDHFKAAVLKEFGKKLEIKEMKSPKKLNDHDVKVKVRCCAVNVTDALLCFGEYDVKPKLPFIPGFEFSGEVLEVGSSVKTFAKGDKVIGLNKEKFSAMAQECIVSKQDIWKIPQDMSYEKATALTDNYATVLLAARRVNLCEGDEILVTASAGGLGLAAVDITANLFKAKVIGACDTEDEASFLRDKGAFSSIIYSKKELKKAVMKETNNVGVKVIFDAIGGDLFEDCMQSIALEGSIVVMGFASRKIPQIWTNQLLPRSCAVIGVSLTHYKNLANDLYRNTVQEVIDMYMEDFIEPQIVARFDFEDVNDAFKFIEERKSTGKVIVNVK